MAATVPARPPDGRAVRRLPRPSRWIWSSSTRPSRPRTASSTIATPARRRPPRELSRTVPVVFGGQTWTLRLATLPAFHSLAERLVPYWVLGSGLLISVLAFVITLLQTRALTAARRLGAELQTAERRLRRANERFELAASAVGSAIYDWNLQHGTVAWTQGLTEMSGYRLEDIEPDVRLVDRADPSRRPAARPGALPGRRGQRRRLRGGVPLPRPRRPLPRRARPRPVRPRRGRPRGAVVGSMADISERKRGESVLRDSEARHRAVLETAMDAFVGMDHEGRGDRVQPGGRADVRVRARGHDRPGAGRGDHPRALPGGAPARAGALPGHRRAHAAGRPHRGDGPARRRDRVPGGADRDRGADGGPAPVQRLRPGPHRAEARGRGPERASRCSSSRRRRWRRWAGSRAGSPTTSTTC